MDDKEVVKTLISIRDYLCSGNPIWDIDTVREAMNEAISAVEAREDKDVGKLCYKIYAKYKQQRMHGTIQYDFFVDTVGRLNHWRIFNPTVLYIRERPFTKSDRTRLGKTVFWTREEAEQAIKRKERENEEHEHYRGV